MSHGDVSTHVPAATPEGRAHLKSLITSGTRVIRLIHADFFGRQRAKQFPISMVDDLFDGVAYSKMSLSEDLLGVPVDEDTFPMVKGHPDLFAFIEPETAIVPPWEPDAIWVLASLYEQDGRSTFCARGTLARARTQLHEKLGYTAVAAGEPEFYLFNTEHGQSSKTPYARDGVSYTMDRVTDPDGIVGIIHRNLVDFNIGVTVVNREFSPGQFEINLHHAESQTAADQAFLLKTAIKELAVINGLRANFMAKPITGEEGSSLHVHMSFWDEAGNVFDDGNGNLTDVALSAIAGIQAHAPAIMSFAAPTVNSYKRMRGIGLSPRQSNWAEDNRYSFLRVPPEHGKATRFELRAGDASASSHLLMAAMIFAAIDGVERQLQPTAEGVPLPRSLNESLEALESDLHLRDALGEELVSVYAAIKRAEIESYESTVTDWEWNLYNSHA